MKDRIGERLEEIAVEHGIKILYACESGSRAWGFASADSDYDVRFLYAWPEEQYLSVFDPKDMIDLGVDSEDLDITGWDLRKALRQGRKSNGSLTEWLFSPVVYRENADVMARWRELAIETFVPRASAAHYFGLSQKIYGQIAEDSRPPTAKKYLYALRSVLAGRYVAEKLKPVPVAFAELREQLDISSEAADAIDEMISEKSTGAESDAIERNSILDQFIESEKEQLAGKLSELPGEISPVVKFDRFFRSCILK